MIEKEEAGKRIAVTLRQIMCVVESRVLLE